MSDLALKTLTAVGKGGVNQQTLWNDGQNTAHVQTVPRSLMLSLSGDCSYDHVVELCFYVGRHWKPRLERLVLDFTQLKSADSDGIHFLVSQLIRVASQSDGDIYLVRTPAEARSLLARTWGKPEIHSVQTLKEALLD